MGPKGGRTSALAIEAKLVEEIADRTKRAWSSRAAEKLAPARETCEKSAKSSAANCSLMPSSVGVRISANEKSAPS